MSEPQANPDPTLPRNQNGRGRDSSHARRAIGYLMSSSPGPPGFRFSWTDAAAVIVAFATSALLWNTLHEWALLFPIVLGHFFLFCNVFRVCRAFELTWAAIFVANFAAWAMSGHLSWWYALLVQTPFTLTFLVLEIRSPRYHGIRVFAGAPRSRDATKEVD